MTHSPVMHSPHVIHANKPKIESSGRGFTPVTSANALGSQHAPPSSQTHHVTTPPRPMSTHTPGLTGTPHSQSQHTPPLGGSGEYHMTSKTLYRTAMSAHSAHLTVTWITRLIFSLCLNSLSFAQVFIHSIMR